MQKNTICIFLSLVFGLISILVYSQEKLIFAVSYIRHGDRAPYEIMSVFNHNWTEGEGGLTAEGMRQEYDLGKQMRERYVTQLQLLPESFQMGTMSVFSTAKIRTTMSAESFLYGFYPLKTGPKLTNGEYALPEGFQPIPIVTMSSKDKNIINPEVSDPEACDKVVNQYAFSHQAWIDNDNKYKDDIKRWSELFGIKITDMRGFLAPADNINCLYRHNYPLPSGLTKEDAEKIMKVSLDACVLRFIPKPVYTFYAAPFLSTVTENMQAAVNGKQSCKYMVYLGHDDPMICIMNALNNPLSSNPPFAAHVDLELYQDGATYTVKVLYNGTPLALTDDKKKNVYSFGEFAEIIKNNITN